MGEEKARAKKQKESEEAEMRDRLIELIGSKVCEAYSPTCDEWQPHSCEKCFANSCRIGDLADHLLANGVVVSPVELGSKHRVYIPVKGTTVVYETKVYGIGVDEDGDMVINPKEYPEEVICINGYNIGKTVFLTKEEAVQALAERSGE